MKKMMVAALLIAGMASFAQEKKPMGKRSPMEQFTPEQRNELRLKKMTLDLDLNTSQQKDMAKLIAEQSTKMEAAKAERKAKMQSNQKPATADERFAKENQMLDDQIAMKEKVKKILTPEQFGKWEKMGAHRHHGMKPPVRERKTKPEDK